METAKLEREIPTVEVFEKPVRRRFSTEYKVRILTEADRCVKMGQLGEMLRREGLYSSLLSTWRAQRDAGMLAGLAPNGVGARRKPRTRWLMKTDDYSVRIYA